MPSFLEKQMNDKRIPMMPDRKQSLPVIYGDTPTFLGVPILKDIRRQKDSDVVVAGVPWEGSVTWGSFSSCELAPRTIRHASARYGGFLPEHNIDLFDHLKIADMGDIAVVPGNPKATMENVLLMAREIYNAGSVPVVLGGDHSFTPQIVRALSECSTGRVGVIHFDAHLDNSERYGNDDFPRCGPIYGISKIKKVRNESVVHIGIRGPRNSRAQFEYAQEMGATIFDIESVHRRGIEAIIEEAIAIAKKRTERFYVTICSDCMDVAYNAGGPIDFNGLQPRELFHSLYRLGEEGFSGLDYVEVYPLFDNRSISSHLAAWAIIYALAGLASHKRATRRPDVKK